MMYENWRGVYENWANDMERTHAFEIAALRRLPLSIDLADWTCPDLSARENDPNRPTAVNESSKRTVHTTTRNQLSYPEVRRLEAARDAGYKPHQVFGSKPTAAALQKVRAVGGTYSVHQARGVPTSPRPSPWSLAPGSTRTTSPVHDLARSSGTTADDARQRVDANNRLNQTSARGGGMPKLGGIDWRSLELRYVSDDPDHDDVGYAFSAEEPPEEVAQEDPGFGGLAALDLSRDALNTWLALDPSQFWVNLNPDMPATIIDAEFATTDAGRVLLEADLEFKRTVADHMDPDTEVGGEFWESLERTSDGLVCHGSFRFWVEPLPATVREDGDELYVLDAPLRAQIEPFHIDYRPPGSELCADAPDDLIERNTQLLADTFAPLLEDEVNSSPVYADLRRVYTARVVAEWLKDRDATRPGAFHDIIGSGDVSAWPARTAWDPQEVYDEYLERLHTPVHRYEWTHGEMSYWLDISGGITFPDAPRDPMPAAQFESEHPELPSTVESARYDALTYGETGSSWLGGGTLAAAAPEPTEPPEPTDPPGDDDGGGSPDDEPVTDGGDDTPDPRPAGPDDPAARGDERPAPSRADAAQPGQATTPGTLASTGFGDVGLMVAAIVLVLVGLVLVGIRRRWFPRS